MELPAGTISLLFTDIEGSTRLLAELGDAYADRLEEHNRLLRASFERHRGIELNTWGDAFFVVFRSAPDALAAAIEAQAALEGAGSVKVRMGIHTGEPIRTDEGYVGMDVHRAARIAAAGHGGQILLSRATYELLDPVGLRNLGSHQLKDVGEIQLFQVGEKEFPPVVGIRPTNLPTIGTRLVGRERAQLEVVRTFREEGRRLVTLTGPGGIGKTRLAIEAAGDLIEDFPDGVWLVDLSAVTAPSLVETAICSALGTAADPISFLAGRRTLLLLDNFEQVVGAAQLVSRLLAACPAVGCLVTSREALRIQGEHELPLTPLAEQDACALFVERARSLDPDFRADDDVLEKLCRRLDSLPLAIELAAARVRLLDAPQILERLDARLTLLSGGPRDAPERHRTLEATIDWSYALLGPQERALFARLSVFSGGWTLEAAEQVCGATIDNLEALVEKSLVRAQQGRFDMLETIRAYASDKLEESIDAEVTRRQHMLYFAGLVGRAEPELDGPQQHVWLDVLSTEYDNLRSALHRSMDAETGTDLALHLASGLALYWFLRGPFTEGVQWLEKAIERSGDTFAKDRPAVLWGAGLLWTIIGDRVRAHFLTEEGLALARSLHDGSMVARCLDVLGLLALLENDLSMARSLLEESIASARASGDVWCLADALGTLGSIYPLLGEFERSREAGNEALDIARQRDDRQGMRMALFALALCDARLERFDTARRASEEGLAICRLIGDQFFCSYFLWIASLVARERGDLADARASADESLQIAEDLQVPLLLVCALEASAGVLCAEGDGSQAERLLRRAAEIGERGMVPLSYVATVHRALGTLAVQRGDAASARTEFEESLSLAGSVDDAWGVEQSRAAMASIASG